MRRTWVAVAVVAALGLAACSGVPDSSAPKVIRTIAQGAAPSAQPTITPIPGSDPREIVTDFLAANLGVDSHHSAARAFLTQDERTRWNDSTVTVVGSYQVSVADPITHQVTVTADQIGSIDKNGVYTPLLNGDGSTGTTVPFPFAMTLVDGQWRISGLNNGLIVDRAGFRSAYQPRSIYFLDQSQHRLVPDLRYSALTDQPLCTWLLEQLIAGPASPELSTAAVVSEVGEQTSRASVTCAGSAIDVDLPGSSQLGGQARVRLAAQLANTFELDFSTTLRLTDSGRAVTIPGVASPFSADAISGFSTSGPPPPLYYVHDGGVLAADGSQVGGPEGTGAYHLVSLGLAASQDGATSLAGVGSNGSGTRLFTGTLRGTMTGVELPPGPLSRPVWAVGQHEVWIGVGSALWRLVPGSSSLSRVQLTPQALTVGRINSVAFSPDGARIALVVTPDGGAGTVLVGSVIRTGTTVRVDDLTPVTPTGVSMVDVAWNDATTMYVVGGDPTRKGNFGIWSVQLDGSLFTSRPISGLPGEPDSIAVTSQSLPWVAAASAVWEFRDNTWTSPATNGETTLGASPSYAQ